LEICYSAEDRPLGTGGAVWKALRAVSLDDVFVFNGDTIFDISLSEMREFHRSMGADITLALKPMRNIERYGTVALIDGRIIEFREKKKTDQGLINGGVYLMNRSLAERFDLPERFSLETDFLEKMVDALTIGGYVHRGYFLDIGVPEDYARAQKELPLPRSS
jgi:D-glycero-alpha-D-manno-heptose 1-phosphate guanylyltransferase